jgi:2,3-bisphosphoglycerate-independent phosphoglycerate mutase
MDAYTVTEDLLKRLENNEYGFIAVNFANCDMVGHTGDFDAARQAVEIVDECVGKVVKRLLELDAKILITADHGNADQMVDYETGMTKTSHTLNLVDCIYVANDAEGVKLRKEGILSDIAPTVLDLMGIEVPADMTSKSLLA